MSASLLKPLLANEGVTPANVVRFSGLCEAWFMAEPALETFALRAVARELLAQGWDDQQGIPTATVSQFQQSALPELILLVDLIGNSTPDQLSLAVECLVKGLHAFLAGAAGQTP